jgi:hypothetical protein
MAWNDPSPRPRPLASRPSSPPGYGDTPISFGRLVLRMVVAGIVGVLASVLAKACLAALHGNAAHASGLATVLAVAAGFVVAALAWRYVMSRPAQRGLSARIRDGGGWGGGGWGRSSGYDNYTVGDAIVADAAVDLVDAAIDIATDL